MAVRNLEKGEKARADILQEVPDAKLDLMALDNMSLDSVRDFADAFKEKNDRLDILIKNAGLMAIPHQATVDGLEMQLDVNHLAHFTLTGLLLDVITNTPGARVHSVSSGGAPLIATSSSCCQTGFRPLADEITFELGKGTKNVEDQYATG
mgnify:CR=1 FL=1